jgi:hypothetical protein
MAEGNGNSPRLAFTFDATTIVAVLGLIGGAALFVTQTRGDAQIAKDEAQRLRLEIRDQITETRGQLDRGITGIRAEIAGLPAAAAHLTEIDHRLADIARWQEGAERRDTEQRDLIGGLTSRVGNLERQENAAHGR